MTLLNLTLIVVGPFVVVGSLLAAVRLSDRVSEREAESLRRLGKATVESAEAGAQTSVRR